MSLIDDCTLETENINSDIVPNLNDLEPVIRITFHAYDRAKERLRWKVKVLDKMAEKAFLEGVKHKDTRGALNKYLNEIWSNHKKSDNVRIYGEVIFLFANNVLITLYQLPYELRKHVKFCSNRQKLLL